MRGSTTELLKDIHISYSFFKQLNFTQLFNIDFYWQAVILYLFKNGPVFYSFSKCSLYSVHIVFYFSGMVLPFHENRDCNIYLGVLMCLRHMIPNLDNSRSSKHCMRGLRGSFGRQGSYAGDGPQFDKDMETKKLVQVWI